jgi:hypothetical protein
MIAEELVEPNVRNAKAKVQQSASYVLEQEELMEISVQIVKAKVQELVGRVIEEAL